MKVQVATKYACDFCRKHQDEVAKIILGPDVAICNECVAICNTIIDKPAGAVAHAASCASAGPAAGCYCQSATTASAN